METDVENSDGRFTKQEIIVFDSLQSTDWLNIDGEIMRMKQTN